MIDPEIIEPEPTSITVSAFQITEISEDMLPAEADVAQARSILADYILEGDATADEISALVALYPPYEVGEAYAIRDIFSHAGKLYKVNQAHESAEQWVPGATGTEALYTEIAPAGVIPIWTQPTGAHDSYHVGDFVQYPEGTVWECTAGDASGSNSWQPGVYGWTQVQS